MGCVERGLTDDPGAMWLERQRGRLVGHTCLVQVHILGELFLQHVL